MPDLSAWPAWLAAHIPAWIQAFGVFIAIFAAGLVLQAVLMRLVGVRAERRHPFLVHVFGRTRVLVRFIILVFALGTALPILPLSQNAKDIGHNILVALFVVQLGWIALVAANIAIDRYVYGFKLDTSDNLLARKAVTQMRIVRQAVNVLLITLTAGFALMSFDSVRQFGISLFASAGIAGIVAGIAARPIFENLLAGLQLAFTQPVRIGDAVVINGEWGWVEEIGSVYIVVKLWDWRRQIVPLAYIFANPFTNWTRSSSSIIGTVLVYADYTLPMDKVREAATRIVRASKLWDGQVVNVQVSDAKEQVMEVRVLASASDSSRAWDLRCEVREKLIGYIREHFPDSLPRRRQELLALPAEAARKGQSAALPLRGLPG